MNGRVRILSGATVLCGLISLVAAQSSSNILGSSTYSAEQIRIKEVELTNEGKVKITFNAMAESAWYCPGANAKTTKKGVELTFVRAWFKSRPKVTYPAKVEENRLTRSIVVDAKSKAVFMKSGKKLVRIFPPKEAGQPTRQAHAQRLLGSDPFRHGA